MIFGKIKAADIDGGSFAKKEAFGYFLINFLFFMYPSVTITPDKIIAAESSYEILQYDKAADTATAII